MKGSTVFNIPHVKENMIYDDRIQVRLRGELVHLKNIFKFHTRLIFPKSCMLLFFIHLKPDPIPPQSAYWCSVPMCTVGWVDSSQCRPTCDLPIEIIATMQNPTVLLY